MGFQKKAYFEPCFRGVRQSKKLKVLYSGKIGIYLFGKKFDFALVAFISVPPVPLPAVRPRRRRQYLRHSRHLRRKGKGL